MPRDLEHRAAFESQGETIVRMLAQQGGPIGAEATAWLAEQQSLRDEASSAKRDAREERTLEIAAEALSNSKDANRIASEALSASRSNARWAMYAAIVATIAIAVGIKDQILALVFGVP